MNKKKIIIIGAGPAGLACGLELVKKGQLVEIYEADKQVGGISKTVTWQGYRFDIGGHRFFTKSPEVEKVWQEILGKEFLQRQRLSRIYYQKKFFYYPIKPFDALFKLGLWQAFISGLSFIKAKIIPRKPEKSFHDWVANRFGERLFQHFFKSYTEKVWGISTDVLSADWAAQRIKGLSLYKAIKDAFFRSKHGEIKTLITKFNYPKYGPGMMYEAIAKKIESLGGKVFLHSPVNKLKHQQNQIKSVITKTKTGEKEIMGDYFVSSMPYNQMVLAFTPCLAPTARNAASKLTFRSFLSVNLIINQPNLFPDNWIYVHSPEVKLGRIQNFKNWSPYMSPDKSKTNLGLEYFCNQGDSFWNKPVDELVAIGIKEIDQIGLAKKEDVINGHVYKMSNAYPVYHKDYKQQMEIVRSKLKKFINFQIIGRGGTFRYNNMDHSILTGLYAAKNILGGNYDIDSVNIEEEYHETKK